MTRQNIVGVLLASSTAGIGIWAEIKLDDGVLGDAVFGEMIESVYG